MPTRWPCFRADSARWTRVIEALTLMQTGKGRLVPLVLMDRPGGNYWKTWDKNVREQLLRAELISPDDLHLYQIASFARPRGADHHAVLSQLSFQPVRERFARHPLEKRPAALGAAGLNEDFADIISGEKFHAIAATPQEREDDDCVEMGRIAFGFDRRQYGRLRQLIDSLNSF